MAKSGTEVRVTCDHCNKVTTCSSAGVLELVPQCLCGQPYLHRWGRAKFAGPKRKRVYVFCCSVEECKATLPVQDLPKWHADKNQLYKGVVVP